MAITRSYANGFEVVDFTEELVSIPNSYGLINGLNLFQAEPVTQNVVVFEETTKDGALLIDRVQGERAFVGKDATRKLHTFSLQHFPYDDYISPQDLAGKRAYGSDGAETIDAVRVRKLERIRRSHSMTLEFARAQAITLGTVYSPSGLSTQDWNSEFGVTRTTVDFLLGTSTTEVIAKIEACLAQIMDNTGGEIMSGTVTLCSPEFFAKLISHQSVKTAYQFYASTQEPMRQRLGGDNAMRREFVFGGTKFIESRDNFAGTRLIPAGKAYMVPTGTDIFKTFQGPPAIFSLVGTQGEEVYVFESADQHGTRIDLRSEANFCNAVMRPAMIVTLNSSN